MFTISGGRARNARVVPPILPAAWIRETGRVRGSAGSSANAMLDVFEGGPKGVA